MGRRTVVGAFVHNRWAMINIRASNGKYRHLKNHKSATYEEVEIRMSREDFKSWCWSQQSKIETMARPSIDRINKGGHYEISNLQIIELADNIRKDKTVFKEGFGVCFSCKERKEESLFTRDSRRLNGRTSICLKCESKRTTQNNKRKRDRQ